MMTYRSLGLLILSLLCSTSAAFADHNITIQNHFTVPIIISVQPTHSHWHKASKVRGDCLNTAIQPGQTSCIIDLIDGKKSYFSSGHAGTITLQDASNPANACTISYSHTNEIISRNITKNSETFGSPVCKGSFTPKMISMVTPHLYYHVRPLCDISNVCEKLSEQDCGGPKNCLIVSPALNTLTNALNIQASLSQYEPLDVEQFLGGHNSAVSRQYTTSSSLGNLNHSDPNAYLSLTQQLNLGVRQVELDIEWDKHSNKILICHDHVSSNKIVQNVLCDDNTPMENVLSELNTYANAHPDELLLIYFDVNEAIDGHITTFDNDIAATIGSHVYQPKDAEASFGSSSLPTTQLNAFGLTHKENKNVIMINNDGKGSGPDLGQSAYVFVNSGPKSQPSLPDSGIGSFTVAGIQCQGNPDKYQQVNAQSLDAYHFSILRVLEDRTALSYDDTTFHKKPDKGIDFITTTNMPSVMACPFNVIGFDMLGYAPSDSADADTENTDPRLAMALWSWQVGYPLADGSNMATISPTTHHFVNDPLTQGQQVNVLCYRGPAPNGLNNPLNWYTAPMKILTPSGLRMTAQAYQLNQAYGLCQASGGHFASPVTSYWMDDVLSMLKRTGNQLSVMVNLVRSGAEWVPNNRRSLIHLLAY